LILVNLHRICNTHINQKVSASEVGVATSTHLFGSFSVITAEPLTLKSNVILNNNHHYRK